MRSLIAALCLFACALNAMGLLDSLFDRQIGFALIDLMLLTGAAFAAAIVWSA